MNFHTELVARYITKGEGIEIGALDHKTSVPDGVKVYYVDKHPVDKLRVMYPELADKPLVDADILDDGETLDSIEDKFYDFIIAKHMIEHCRNPIGTLKTFLRVLKVGGIIYLGVPDKRYTFDFERSITPLEHIIRDYEEGPEWSHLSHYEDWVRVVEKVSEEQFSTRVQELYDQDRDLHFHVWTSQDFLELLIFCQRQLAFNFEIEFFKNYDIECIAILRKTQKYLRLDLGCGSNKKTGTIGLDIVQAPGVDYVINIENDKLPFADRSVEYIYSSHTLEHLSQSAPIHLFQEMGRVCIDRAKLELWTPYGWDNSAFIFGHTTIYNEDHYLHLCVWFGHIWQQSLGARWLLQEIIYIVSPETLVELKEQKIPIEFAINYYQNVVKELGVVIEVRHDYTGQTIHPKRTYSTSKNSDRYPLKINSEPLDENKLAEAIHYFSTPSENI